MECFVALANSTLVNIVVSTKGKGQECMDEVCRILGIIEQDYFGLSYKGNRGENLYLNLRNRLDRQLLGPAPHRLQLRVKFYVPPHNLQQQATRNQFYEHVKQDLESQKLVLECEEQVKHIVALIAQADYGKYDKRSHQLNLYKTLYMTITEEEPSPQLIHSIVENHAQLRDLSREAAQYQVLQVASELPSYGVEFHEATYGTEITQVGLGPSGVMLFNNNMEMIERLPYSVVTKVEHIGKTCVLKVLNDNGTENEMVLRLGSQSTANSFYRCITEMHSFFCCETVHNEVSSQFSRDLKGTLASIFNEKTTLGRDYVFDIKRTLRETLDHTRRLMYQSVVSGDATDEGGASDSEGSDCESHSLNMEDRCQVLEDTLERIQESFTCCVCRDNDLTAALVPCGHLTCIDCAEKLSECPLCRKQINARQRIFFPTMQCDGTSCTSSISLKTVKSPVHRHCHKRKREPYMDALEAAES